MLSSNEPPAEPPIEPAVLIPTADGIWISRAELEQEHSILIARIHQLRRWLNYPPLLTGKEKRRQLTHE